MSDIRLTPRFRQVISLAKQSAQQYNHKFIGTEHMILGMLELGDCAGVNVLKQFKLDIAKFRSSLISRLQQVSTGDVDFQADPRDINCSPKAQKILVNLKVLADKNTLAFPYSVSGRSDVVSVHKLSFSPIP